ncbi:MAG: AAA family ATPase [Crocosphaera sp.]|nr:AAA family ATPase [Crocosphaera sp.]NQZ60968.1 AAA family ATPase [Crocosphaera sp.]
MDHFNPNDAQYFFGRDFFIEELYQATKNRNFIPILGASGSGKSSVVFAGLVPRLQEDGNWLFTYFRPGSARDPFSTLPDPFYALAEALVPLYRLEIDSTNEITQAVDLSDEFKNGNTSLSHVFSNIERKHPKQRLLLIADQFEELYYCDLDTQHKFLDLLTSNFSQNKNLGLFSIYKLSPVLVITMRTDFLGNALSYPNFADLLRKNDTKIRSMNRQELTEVIEKPAHKLGVAFESGLVELILDDIEAKPGNLPLLEFALIELWNQGNSKELTHKIYNKIGQVQGSLARYAE